MKIRNILMLTCLILAVSCEQDPLTLDQIAQEAAIDSEEMVARGVTKKLKIKRASGTMTQVDLKPCDNILDPFVEGTGIASHLGKFSIENYMCLDGEKVRIRGVMTAANGDKIFTYVSAPPWVQDGLTYYQYTIYGGSGRFQGITGEIVVYGTFGPTSWSLSGEGYFTYP